MIIKVLTVFLGVLVSLPSLALERFEQLTWLEPQSSTYQLIQYPELLSDIYQENDDQLIWFDVEQSKKLELQLEMIDKAGFSPLFSERLQQLQLFRTQNRWFEYDLLATDTLLLYISYAEQAPLMGKSWFFNQPLTGSLPAPTKEATNSLLVSIELNQLSEFIDDYTPSNEDYRQISGSYQHLKQFEHTELPRYHQNRLKKVGDKLSHRDELILRLNVVNIDTKSIRKDVSWYDASLIWPIKEFQRIHGLKQDGMIGNQTMKWLNMDPSLRLSMLALNAERSRLWPMQRDTVILVNVPSFDMSYWYQGEEVFQSKVVVGKTSRKTPVMHTKLDSLILNPTWNVPWKIMVEDILPQVKRDKTYLTNHNIEIIERWNAVSTVNPSEINWSEVTPETFPYKMRQQSGKRNALGLYKFNTPNRRAIFLHDTPSKHLFSKDVRAFSSGCVRVEHADKFAYTLLATQGMDMADAGKNDQSTTHAIPLKKRIPVHIIYQTVWVESGQVQYRDDIYQYDTLSQNRQPQTEG
ncbi:L,D-transpeptidase family protein [Vibrio genomosp. F10]|uniref:L,D-transpeptidase family protein n=1 Tax=Vibrio genomosp. F10 TaxID=723171 RepID=UPI0003193205|nr:L,D-transpeptidase family protein [Vibrio genomosp. F10]OEE96851.1 peptidase [Vibrio genomosp. F10 str. 9ZD137]OEF03881.1 peptidase [Vibrio genomosp. F10 str. 9ZB36]